MTKLKIAVVLTMAALFPLAGCVASAESRPTMTVTGFGDYATFATQDELASRSELVIIGTVQSVKTFEMKPKNVGSDPTLNPAAGAGRAESGAGPGLVASRISVKVAKAFKGGAGPVIQVVQMGGVKDGVLYIDYGAPALQIGSEYLLLLRSGEDGFTILGGMQGQYQADASGRFVASAPGNPIRSMTTEELLASIERTKKK